MIQRHSNSFKYMEDWHIEENLTLYYWSEETGKLLEKLERLAVQNKIKLFKQPRFAKTTC